MSSLGSQTCGSLPAVDSSMPAGPAAIATAAQSPATFGLLLVPLPLLAYAVLRAFAVPVGVAEDLVTVAVMVPLGGPHVVATLRRTFGTAAFWRDQLPLAMASVAILVLVAAAAVGSAFFGFVIDGRPAMTHLLTFFFFWAGLHVVQQHAVVAARLRAHDREPAMRRRAWLGAVVVLTSLYPVALFRMSMARADGGPGAAPDALATRCLLGLGFDRQFVDDYVFRIGRVAPVLPDLMHQAWVWLLVGAVFAIATTCFVVSLRTGKRNDPRGDSHARFVLAVALVGTLVPLFPNLDVAFQGVNAWHCCQYLALLAAPMGVAVPALGRPDRRSWLLGVAASLGLVAAILLFALLLEWGTGGAFLAFGHEEPPTDGASRVLYRPGGVLLGYYLLGFGFLLVHYLCDTVHFVARGARASVR